MTESISAAYTLDLGGTVLRFNCQPEQLAPYLAAWFDRPSADTAAHLTLDLELVPHAEQLDIPNTLLKTKTVDQNGNFDIHHGLFAGSLDRDTATGSIRVKAGLSRGQLMRVMEQIFYQAYYSARTLSGANAFLIHSSAAIVDGRGFLFVGPSEAGKTTAILNSAQYHVLGDEMNLVSEQDGQLMLAGTPFNGLFRDKKPGQAPLTAVFILAQAPHHRLLPVEPGEATASLASEVVPMIGLDQVPGPETVPQMVDAAAELVERVPVRTLEFQPDPGFWQEITREFKLNPR